MSKKQTAFLGFEKIFFEIFISAKQICVIYKHGFHNTGNVASHLYIWEKEVLKPSFEKLRKYPANIYFLKVRNKKNPTKTN